MKKVLPLLFALCLSLALGFAFADPSAPMVTYDGNGHGQHIPAPIPSRTAATRSA